MSDLAAVYAQGYEHRCYVHEVVSAERARRPSWHCDGSLVACRILDPRPIVERFPNGMPYRERDSVVLQHYRSLSDLLADARNFLPACEGKHAPMAGWRECEGQGPVDDVRTLRFECPRCHGTGYLAPELVLPVESYPTVLYAPESFSDSTAIGSVEDIRRSPLREFMAELGLEGAA